MNDEKVKEALWDRIFFDFSGNVPLLTDGVFSKGPVTEHNDNEADKIDPQHPNVHIGRRVFTVFILFDHTGVKTAWRSENQR